MATKTNTVPRASAVEHNAAHLSPPRSVWITCAQGQQTGQEVSAQALLGGQDELHILHGERRYTLRKTKQNKLILVA